MNTNMLKPNLNLSSINLLQLSILFSALISLTISRGKFAVCVLTPDNNSTLYGNVSFTQINESATLRVDYNIQNITGIRAFHIHQNPNITGGCLSTGGHYNPTNETHGSANSAVRHVGDFGNLEASVGNQIKQSVYYNGTSLYGQNTILNRACVIHANPDDLGLAQNANSLLNGNAGTRIGCGVLYEVNEEAVFLPAASDSLKFGLFSKMVVVVFVFIAVFLI